VEVVEVRDAAAVRRELSRVLHRLVTEGQGRPEDVAILSGRTWENSSLADSEQLGNFQILRNPGGTPGKVTFETIHAFKGLERPIFEARLTSEPPGLAREHD
jgi:hypothetical protein